MKTVIFCGPSLPHAEARALAGRDAAVLPPARQGDVYRLLSAQPRAIALIDGVFESVPSVWHRELLAALEAGVHVFGASSMGALRAAELAPYGMIGVGEIFEAVRAGRITDDAEVALLHADAEHGFRPLTVPWVNAQHALAVAKRERRIDARTHDALHAAARALHYQQRTWPEVLSAVALTAEAKRALLRWLREDAPDLKREDARLCIQRALAARGEPARPAVPPPPTHARVRQLLQSETITKARSVRGEAVLSALRERPEAASLVEDGMRTLALAAFARSVGLRAGPEEIEDGVASFLGDAGAAPAALGLDRAQLRAIGEAIALERQVIAHAPRLFPDGPSHLEALALGARRRRRWRAGPPGVKRTRSRK